MGIPVEDQTDPSTRQTDDRGKRIACALIGPNAECFEIFVPDQWTESAPNDGASYYINGVQVHVEVYRDALNTANNDRYCPACNGMHIVGHEDDENGFVSIKEDDEPDSSQGEPS